MNLETSRASLAREVCNEMCHNRWYLFKFRVSNNDRTARSHCLRYVVWIDNEDVWESVKTEDGGYPDALTDKMWRNLADEIFANFLASYMGKDFSKEDTSVLKQIVAECNETIYAYNH